MTVFERVIGRGIAEEAGDPDQQVLEQQQHLARIGVQPPDIVGRFQPQELHPPLHAPDEGGALVAAEVVADLVAEDPADLRHQIDQ
ncbi:MAG: hypothetical protein WDN25_18485 [Acetobacteraceae bacterium]